MTRGIKRMMNEEQCEGIRDLYFQTTPKGVSAYRLAQMYNCSRPTIVHILDKTGAYADPCGS